MLCDLQILPIRSYFSQHKSVLVTFFFTLIKLRFEKFFNSWIISEFCPLQCEVGVKEAA